MPTNAGRLKAAITAATIALALAVACAPAPPAAQDEAYTSRDAMIPMRDGVSLHVKIFTPADQQGSLPIIMRRTPYGVENAGRSLSTSYKALADERYIFVFADIRGKYGSEGDYVMNRPLSGLVRRIPDADGARQSAPRAEGLGADEHDG